MNLLWVRHGHSCHGVQNIIADLRGCRGLTEQGVRQSKALGARLQARRNEWTVVLTSPVLRALQTAEHVCAALEIPKPILDKDLRELIPGQADGLSREKYQEIYGAFDLIQEPERPFSPGGESWSQFEQRVEATIDNWTIRYNRKIL
jgi:broad specificity phosphatase PhoE